MRILETLLFKLLKNLEREANNCLSILYRSIWDIERYNKMKDFCRQNQKTAQALLPLERDRLQIARTNCQQYAKVTDCIVHNTIEGQIYQLYTETW